MRGCCSWKTSRCRHRRTWSRRCRGLRSNATATAATRGPAPSARLSTRRASPWPGSPACTASTLTASQSGWEHTPRSAPCARRRCAEPAGTGGSWRKLEAWLGRSWKSSAFSRFELPGVHARRWCADSARLRPAHGAVLSCRKLGRSWRHGWAQG